MKNTLTLILGRKNQKSPCVCTSYVVRRTYVSRATGHTVQPIWFKVFLGIWSPPRTCKKPFVFWNFEPFGLQPPFCGPCYPYGAKKKFRILEIFFTEMDRGLKYLSENVIQANKIIDSFRYIELEIFFLNFGIFFPEMFKGLN